MTRSGSPRGRKGLGMTTEIEKLEARLAALEDRAAIAELIAGYGPCVDALDGAGAAAAWAEAGTYEIGPAMTLRGQHEIAGIAAMDQHRDYVARGSAHILSPHKITLDGSTARAHGYSVVFLHEAKTGRWIAERVSANRWEFRKSADGWRVSERRVALLDGSAAASALLRWTSPEGASQ